MQVLITIKEARKLLGSDNSEMSDEQVQKHIDKLSLLAKLALEDARAKFLQGEL